ncbi:hypothetical protein HDZ31DRAFT_78081, partial [Schizophyllum fasciatum]
MVRQQSGGIRLPQSILDEIHGSAESHKRGHGNKSKLSRKEARKQEREGRKQKKAQYFSAPHAPNPVKRPAEDDHADSPRRKKPKTESASAPPASRTEKSQRTEEVKEANNKSTEKKVKDTKKPTALAKLAGETSKKFSKAAPRSRVESEEDNYIAYLESKLGLKQGKRKTNPEEDDGLDDLLDFASKFDNVDDAGVETSGSESETEDGESDEAMDDEVDEADDGE